MKQDKNNTKSAEIKRQEESNTVHVTIHCPADSPSGQGVQHKPTCTLVVLRRCHPNKGVEAGQRAPSWQVGKLLRGILQTCSAQPALIQVGDKLVKRR